MSADLAILPAPTLSLDEQIEAVEARLEALIRKAETGEHWAAIAKIEADELAPLLKRKVNERVRNLHARAHGNASRNPFEVARSHLIRRLLDIVPPVAFPSFPTPGHHEGVAAHLREAAQIFDEWLAAVGAEVRDNATTSINAGLFSGSFTAAVDGNETGACEEEALSLREERRAMRRAS